MKVEELFPFIQDNEVVLYRQVGLLEFDYLFKGRKEIMSKELFWLDIKRLGSLDYRVLDIEVM